MAEYIEVEVAYARADRQRIVTLKLAPGATALDAVRASGLALEFADINLDQLRLGVFGKVVAADRPLRARDRVEIYRPLLADPKEVRRRRAAERKTAG
jgi:hypothetical protein